MKLPIIIQHHSYEYILRIPDNEFKNMLKNGKPASKEDIFRQISERVFSGNSDPKLSFPEKWKVPVKKYSGVIYGLDTVSSISAEADTKEELIEILKSKAIEICYSFADEAKREWLNPFEIVEIEI